MRARLPLLCQSWFPSEDDVGSQRQDQESGFKAICPLDDSHPSVCLREPQANPGYYVKFFDKRHLPGPDYKIADLIMLDTRNIKTKCPTRKFTPKSYGPSPMTGGGTRTCTLDLGTRWNIFLVCNVSLLEPYQKSIRAHRQQDWPLPDDIEGQLEYEVEYIIRSVIRTSGRGAQCTNSIFYLVQRLGYPEDKNSWKPAVMMEGLQEIVEQFQKKNPEMPRA